MAGKRLTPDQIERVVSLIKEGKSDDEIASIVGCGGTTVWRIRKEATPAAGTDPVPPVASPPPPVMGAGAGPSFSPDADRAARAKSAAGPEPEVMGKIPPDGEELPPKPDVDPKEAESLVNFSEFVNVTCCRVYAKTKKVPVTNALLKSFRYSKEERDTMMQMAPYAVPYAKYLLEKLPLLMAMGYAVSHVTITADKMSAIDELAPKKPPKEGTPDAGK